MSMHPADPRPSPSASALVAPRDSQTVQPGEAGAQPHAIVVRFPVPWDQVGWGALLAGACLAALLLAVQIRPVSIPLLASFALAYILNPSVDRLCRLGFNRSAAILTLMLGFVLVATLVGVMLGPRIVDEAQEVPAKLRQVLTVLRPSIESLFNIELPDSVDKVLLALQSELAAHEQTPFAAMAQHLTEAFRVVFGGTVSALASLAVLAMVPLFSFYILRDFHGITTGVRSLCPLRMRHQFASVLKEIDAMLGGFVRGQIIVGLILSVLYSVGLFAVGLPLSLFVGIITGLGNMVPFVGTAVGLLLSMLFCLLSWRGYAQPIGVGIVFLVNHGLESWIITPRIVGTSVGLPPFLIIVAVLGFGELFGFIGVLVAVPLAAVVKILGRNLIARYRTSRFYQYQPDIDGPGGMLPPP